MFEHRVLCLTLFQIFRIQLVFLYEVQRVDLLRIKLFQIDTTGISLHMPRLLQFFHFEVFLNVIVERHARAHVTEAVPRQIYGL